jgi:ubiquitin-conjugating enzyme E2 M
MNFQVVVSPDDGYWKGYQYTFDFTVPDMYPHEPPLVKCKEKIYHPNIDLQGNVCLNILRADWKPVLDINAVIYGLIVLFVHPNPDDPLNHEAAEMLRKNKPKFKANVDLSLRGHSVDGEFFPPAIRAVPNKR